MTLIALARTIVVFLLTLLFAYSLTNVANSTKNISFSDMVQRYYIKKTGRTLFITSSRRTVSEQTNLVVAMLRKQKNLRFIYENEKLAAELTRAYYKGGSLSVSYVILKNMRDGIYLSKHLCGKAVDIRIRDKTKKQVKELRELLESGLNVETIVEHHPYHLHVESKEDCDA